MSPPVEVKLSDDLIARLVREHYEKGANDGRLKKHAKKHGMGYAKLAAAVVALTAAVNGYADLQKENLTLAKQNRVLFQAVASKVNGMAERLAYVEGRLEGLKPKEATEAMEEKITPFKPRPASDKPRMKAKAMHEPIEDDMEDAPEPVVEHQPIQTMKMNAYEQLPENLSELMQVQQ